MAALLRVMHSPSDAVANSVSVFLLCRGLYGYQNIHWFVHMLFRVNHCHHSDDAVEVADAAS